MVEGVEHEHAFVKACHPSVSDRRACVTTDRRAPPQGSTEKAAATVRLTRDSPHTPEVRTLARRVGDGPVAACAPLTSRRAAAQVRSQVLSMIVLKTTQSGFENYLVERYTLLPETKERCLATELDASWGYATTGEPIDYAAVRRKVRAELQRGLFGPAHGGVYSASLQASVYDAGCMVLTALPVVDSIAIDTPNLHYLPMKALEALGESFNDDVFLPTSEPSGMIHCTVARQAASR